jgi:hypothetical protein
MNAPSSGGFTPATGSSQSGNEAPERLATNADLQRFIEEMFTRQQNMEAELAATRAAMQQSEAERHQRSAERTQIGEDPSTNALLRTLLETLAATSLSNSAKEVSGPRDWKPPTWDGRAETFRDYLMRLRSSYRVRSATKPTLSQDYYWDTVYNTLPSRERARMRHFWEKGSTTKGKDPEAFFAQLEAVFADSNEQAKALEQLTMMRHSPGQPWHDHQLEFDGLLLSADGESWNDATKIGYLKNTFSNPAKMYTAAVAKTTDYYAFSEEVERIMTNLETTDQFRASHRRWLRERSKDSGLSMTVTAHSRGPAMVARVDADGDTVMAPTNTNGDRNRNRGDRKNANGKQRAKWVDPAERERRRDKRLCFRCGGSGHRIRDCPYEPAIKPASINAVTAQPMLESDAHESDCGWSDPGKE